MKQILILILIIMAGCSSQSIYLPEEIFGLSLSKKLAGKEAAEFINKLHWQGVTDSRSEIGFYRGNIGDAVIYLTYYPSPDQAAEYEELMTTKISAEDTPFIMGEYLDIGGKRIYRTFGMGQTHFVLSHNNALIWISAGTIWADDFLNEYLSLFRTI
jgi:hypothetical protein